MRYFRLSDDMNVQGRWLLGEPTDSQGQEEEPHAERAPRHEADAQLLAERDDRSKWMLDACSAKLAPKVGTPERGRYLSLVVYSTSQVEPSMGDHMMKLQTAPQRGWTDFESVLDAVERELGDGPYFFGDWFTTADVMIGSMFIWMRMLGGKTGRPKLEAYVDRLQARPKGLKLG